MREERIGTRRRDFAVVKLLRQREVMAVIERYMRRNASAGGRRGILHNRLRHCPPDNAIRGLEPLRARQDQDLSYHIRSDERLPLQPLQVGNSRTISPWHLSAIATLEWIASGGFQSSIAASGRSQTLSQNAASSAIFRRWRGILLSTDIPPRGGETPFHGGNTGSNPVGDAKGYRLNLKDLPFRSILRRKDRHSQNPLSFGLPE